MHDTLHKDQHTDELVYRHRLIERQKVANYRASDECQRVSQHQHEYECRVEVQAHAAATSQHHAPVRITVAPQTPAKQNDVECREQQEKHDFANVVLQVFFRQVTRPLAVRLPARWWLQPVGGTAKHSKWEHKV